MTQSSLQKIMVTEEDVQESLHLTEEIIDKFGPRLTGSKECRESAKYIARLFKKHVPDAHTQIQRFDVHPKSFLSFMRVSTFFYLVAIILWQFEGVYPLVAALVISAGLVFGLSQFAFYLQIFDILHRREMGKNVIATLEPVEDVKQQIIISGHHDSAYEFKFLASKWQKWYGIRIILGLIPMFLFFFLAWGHIIFNKYTQELDNFINISRITGLVMLVFVMQLFFFRSNEGTPGAGDNLIASMISLIIAKKFSHLFSKESGLKHTRLIAISFDSEEAGLRGSRRYAEKYKDQLLSIPTYHFNIDSIYNVDELHVLTKDINGFLKLSVDMAEEIKAVAENLGYKMKLFPMTFGGGDTDSAELAKIRITGATTVIAMPTDIIRDGLVYHTMEDTVDKIEPESVKAVMEIVMKYIQKKDEEIASK